jgi:hypothetical protein
LIVAAWIADIIINPPDWRPIVAGTGNEGGTVEDCFRMERRGEVLHAANMAVGRNFVAFYGDGSFGIHIDPGVWHQSVFPVAPSAEFDNRQGRVPACVVVASARR